MKYSDLRKTLIAVLAVAGLFAFIAVVWRHSPAGEQARRMAQCERIIAEVTPSLRADERFAEIELAASTDETIWVMGLFESVPDAQAFLVWAEANITSVPYRWRPSAVGEWLSMGTYEYARKEPVADSEEWETTKGPEIGLPALGTIFNPWE